MSNIKAVLWDVDGTLLDFLAAEREAIKTCFSLFGLGECTDEMIAQYSAINVRWWQALERGEYTKPEILVGRFAEFFTARGIDTAVAPAFNAEYQLRLGDTIKFCPHALETVQALRGIAAQLDPIFISEVVGAEKPSPAFFAPVFAAFPGIKPEEMLIVGDSLTSDIRGGVNAGIQTCWYNPRGHAAPPELRIDYTVSDIAEVLQIVEKSAQ